MEEILDAQRAGCPPEYFNIKIPKGDLLYDKEGRGNIEIPFLRSRYDQSITGYNPNNPRQQVGHASFATNSGLSAKKVKVVRFYAIENATFKQFLLLSCSTSGRNAQSQLYW